VIEMDERPNQIRALLRASGLLPKKSFGQNFLISEEVVNSIAAACVPHAEPKSARVVELGAGLGALTRALVARAAHVTAVERDRDLVPVLARTMQNEVSVGALTIAEADAQTFDVKNALRGAEGPRVLCGNLPYQITGKLLRLAILHADSIDRAVFMVQSEVADRLVANPGQKDYGALTVFVRAAFDVELRTRVSPGAFYPSPGVSSAVVVLVPARPPRAVETENFRALVKGAFSMRRKTLRNAWRSHVQGAALLERLAAEAGVSLDARGETLDVLAFARVAKLLDTATDLAAAPTQEAR
jgi:16S rRNA (adenine1518-N6/adenine1519-N6)-dimethyltransferase